MKQKQIINVLKFILFFGLGLFLLWFSLRNITTDQWAEIKNSFSNLRVEWLLFSGFLGLCSHLSRAARWQSLLATFDHKPSYINTFFALMIGYFGNMVFPRLGEAARCAIINRYEKISIDKVVGTVIVDRALDLLTLALLLIITLTWQYELIGDYFMTKIWPSITGKLNGLISVNGLVFLLVIGLLGILFYSLRHKLGGIYNTFKNIATSFAQGLLSVRKVKNLPLFIAHSIFIWAMYLAMIYVCFYSVDFTGDLGPNVALAILVLGTFGMIATPGGIGAYPALVAVVLGLYGKPYNLSIGFGTMIWGLQYMLTIIVGFICVVGMPIINNNKNKNESFHAGSSQTNSP